MDDGTVVGRALEIVHTVANGIQTPLAELVAQTGIPKPTARRIAEDLVRRQVLIRAPHGYAVGPALAQVGRAAALQQSFGEARDHLVELHSTCGGIAWLCVVQQGGAQLPHPADMVCDRELAGRATAEWPRSTGLEGLVTTAGGRLLLARRLDLLERVARTGVPRATPNSPTTMRQLEATLRQARDLGASVESEQAKLGFRCVAVGFPGPDKGVALLGVTAPVGQSSTARMVAATLRTAESLAASVARRSHVSRRAVD